MGVTAPPCNPIDLEVCSTQLNHSFEGQAPLATRARAYLSARSCIELQRGLLMVSARAKQTSDFQAGAQASNFRPSTML
jgi:hypothetical protein